MYVKRYQVRRGEKHYVYLRLVEVYRDEEGKVRQRIVASLGREDVLKASGQLEQLAGSFARLDPPFLGTRREVGSLLLVQHYLTRLGVKETVDALLPQRGRALLTTSRWPTSGLRRRRGASGRVGSGLSSRPKMPWRASGGASAAPITRPKKRSCVGWAGFSLPPCWSPGGGGGGVRGRPTLEFRRVEAAIAGAARTDGLYALAGNLPGDLSAQDVLRLYKDQWVVEQRHRDLKGPPVSYTHLRAHETV